MTTEIRTICTVGKDGVVSVPVGVEDAGVEVEVTIKPRAVGKLASEMTREGYAAFLDSIEGKWVGEFPEIDDPPAEPMEAL